MGLLSALTTKSVPIGTAGYGNSAYPFVDTYNKTRAPSPMELVRECLGIAYSCGTLNAESIASSVLRFYVRTTKRRPKSWCMESGRTRAVSRKRMSWLEKSSAGASFVRGADKVEEVTSHALIDLMNKPNDASEDGVGMGLFHLMDMTQLYLEIVGRAYWYLEKNGIGGTPSSLWILPAHMVREVPDLSGNRVVDYYEYTGSTIGKPQYQPDEIVPFRCSDLGTGGYVGGTAPMRAAFEQVKVFRQFDGHTNALLSNAGRPDMLWMPKGDGEGGGIGQDEAKRLRVAIGQMFSKAGRGGVAISESPGTIQPLTWPNNEILTAEQYKQIKTLIANCFKVPITKLDRNDANLAGAQTGDYAHAKDAILPRCRRIEAAINTFLLPMYDPDGQMFAAYDNPIPDDQAYELEQAKVGMSSGAWLRNDYRDFTGKEPAPWGDQPLSDGRMVEVDLKTGIPKTPAKMPVDDGQEPAAKKAARLAAMRMAI